MIVNFETAKKSLRYSQTVRQERMLKNAQVLANAGNEEAAKATIDTFKDEMFRKGNR